LDAPCEELRQPTGHERMHSEPSLHPRGAEGGPSIAGESAFCGGVQTYNARGPRGGKQVPNPHYKAVFEKVGRERVNAFLGITEECRTAVFYCVREGLHKRPNLEVESDKKTVDGYLTKLGFGADMAGDLNAAETEYRRANNQFEQKSSLGHLRSFLGHLHRESAKPIAASAGDVLEDKWGSTTLYLRARGCFTKQHESFGHRFTAS
jgi:hypothetical protein